MTDSAQSHMPHNDPTTIPVLGAERSVPPTDGEDTDVAGAVAAFLQHRFPHRHFDVILAQRQIIIQAVPTPGVTPASHCPPAPAPEPSPSATPCQDAAGPRPARKVKKLYSLCLNPLCRKCNHF
jgi:hypothetical protein